jgi:hypothetical protein
VGTRRDGTGRCRQGSVISTALEETNRLGGPRGAAVRLAGRTGQPRIQRGRSSTTGMSRLVPAWYLS